MSGFLRRIRILHPKTKGTEGDESADSTIIHPCTFPLWWRDTSSCFNRRDVPVPLADFGEAVPSYNAEDRDYLVRTIVFEASEEFDEGKAAVAHVILNRTRNGRWGDNIKDVVTDPWRFEPWMTK